MSNQRPGKVVRAIEPSMKDMSMYKFFKLAKKVLEDSGKEDEAFYFEQMEDWLKQGKPIPTTEEQTIKALGV
jgi:hypothetical protein|tara:strand:+ start:19 stop:234 length:216 start_codon:yes stop_codon:yes gene_type:complete